MKKVTILTEKEEKQLKKQREANKKWWNALKGRVEANLEKGLPKGR